MASEAQDFDRIIEPGSHTRRYWAEAWEHRNLFWNLVLRDLRVRYKQTILGVAWGLLRPLITMGAFAVVFGVVANLAADGPVSYPVLVFAGLLPWQLFSTGVLHGAVSLTQNRALVTRIYFPRVLLPAAALVNGVVDLGVAFVVLLVMMLADGHVPDARILLAPAFVALALLASFGAALWLAALNVRYRDFSYIAPFLLQIGLFISPVGFTTQHVPAAWKTVYALNPMVSAIEGLRWSLFGTSGGLDMTMLALSSATALLLLVTGMVWFRRAEATLADVI